MGEKRKVDPIEEALIGDDSLSIDEFLHEMAERGIIPPGKPSIWKRIRHALGAPLRVLSAIVAWVTWRLWGRVQYELAVRKGIARWRQLAGLDVMEPPWAADLRERNRIIAESKPDNATAIAIHNEVIRSKIIPPPKPDVDDTGLPKCVGIAVTGMHRGSPCQYCGEQLADSAGKPVTFPAA